MIEYDCPVVLMDDELFGMYHFIALPPLGSTLKLMNTTGNGVCAELKVRDIIFSGGHRTKLRIKVELVKYIDKKETE
jgi:hypothetical protein